MEKKVQVSAPKPHNLSDEQQLFLGAVKENIKSLGLQVIDLDGELRLNNQVREIGRLDGVLVIAFAQWSGQRLARKKQIAVFPTEFVHLHAAMATTTNRPLLILREKKVAERGALKPNLGGRIIKIPDSLDPVWVNDLNANGQFQQWLSEVKSRRDVFLAYCSKSAGTAAQIQVLLLRMGATVMDWSMDFRTGASILDEIERARAGCAFGIFLFSEDDPLEGINGGAAPRDNVVFESGYFMSSKGAERCLIIREGEAKMPADLGGKIFVHLKKGDDVATIEGRLGSFLKGAD